MGILIACYLFINGHEVRVEGREVRELGSDYSLILPLDKSKPAFKARLNDCEYLEDPVRAYKRWRTEAETLRAATEADKKYWHGVQKQLKSPKQPAKIKPTEAGDAKYCLVEDAETTACFYSTLDACLKVMVRRPGAACILKEDIK